MVEGNLTISGLKDTFLSHAGFRFIQPVLRALTRIDGNLTIRDNNILELPDFTALTRIGGNILIRDNYSLREISGFGSLTGIGGSVDISNNRVSSCCGLLRFLDGTVDPTIAVHHLEQRCWV